MPPRKSARNKAAGASAAAPTKKGKRARSPDVVVSADATAEQASVPTTQKPAKRARSVSKEAVEPAAKEDAAESAKKTPADIAPIQEPSTEPLETHNKRLSGNFDLYSQELLSLCDICLPSGNGRDNSKGPQYEALYKEILNCQAKNDYTAQVFLPGPIVSPYLPGRFSTGVFCDPMSDGRLETEAYPIHKNSLAFTDSEEAGFLELESEFDGPGVAARLVLVEDICGIDSASGSLKLKQIPIWTKESDDGGRPLELFEGHLTVKISYGRLLKWKGHGDGDMFMEAVWAVRARKDSNGNEIGLGGP